MEESGRNHEQALQEPPSVTLPPGCQWHEYPARSLISSFPLIHILSSPIIFGILSIIAYILDVLVQLDYS